MRVSAWAWIVLLLAACVSFTEARAESRLALVIGNSAYENTSPLKNPANDARLIAQTLRGIGFDVTEKTDLTQKEFKRALSDFTQQVRAAGSGTIALFYYAGHGLQSNGTNYLVPVDANIGGDADIPIESVNASEMLQQMEGSGADVSIIVLDACRNNPFPSTKRSVSRGLARMPAPTGSIIAFSTSTGDVAEDGDGTNSTYTLSLSEAIKTPGMPIEQVFKKVRISVMEKTNNDQTPREETSLKSDVVLVPGAAPAPVVPAPQPAPGPLDPDFEYLRALDENSLDGYAKFVRNFPNDPRTQQIRKLVTLMSDEEAWEAATKIDTLASYEVYRVKFPDGIHIPELEQRIKKFRFDSSGSDEQEWQVALECASQADSLADTCAKVKRQAACIEDYRNRRGRSGEHESEALEALDALRDDIESCERGGQSADDRNSIDGTYRGNRGYDSPRGSECLARYPEFSVTIANGRITFFSDGRQWSGIVSAEGRISIDRSGISPPLRSDMQIIGPLAGADVYSGFCGTGWMRLTKVDGGGGHQASTARALTDGTYWAERGYTDPSRPKPTSECPGTIGGLQVVVNGDWMEFNLDGRRMRGQVSADGQIRVDGNNSVIEGRPFRSGFSISGHYSNATMCSGYCKCGFFRIQR